MATVEVVDVVAMAVVAAEEVTRMAPGMYSPFNCSRGMLACCSSTILS